MAAGASEFNYTRITAPISGVIGERLRRPGERIQPTDKLFTVINTSDMIAVIHVPEKAIRQIRKGQKAYLTSDHLRGQQFPGWVKRVSPVVDPASGTFKVTIGVKNRDSLLRPGMFVNVHIIMETHDNALLVPKVAVVYENEKMYVFAVRDSVAHKIEVKPGFQDHEKIEALADLKPGEKIIVVGQAGLKDKTPVSIVAEREVLAQH
ncbi:MAG: efflux RND transporter periplasmic adaptor subunit [candidate division KSB1 bacterium]|nr:efflux RND transporter periplasmic adaptor subunit [candidate division KSB1 bacterium]